MILLDTNQLFRRAYEGYEHSNPGIIPVEVLRGLTVNLIREWRHRFRHQGETVFAVDSLNYWRKKEFPHYKFKKPAKNTDDETKRKMYSGVYRSVVAELQGVCPHRILMVDGAEADDIIAVLSKKFAPTEDVTIVSRDGDFQQLVGGRVKQYNPYSRKLMEYEEDPYALIKKVMCGDSGDGIPNVLSADNSFVNGTRQKAMLQSRLGPILWKWEQNELKDSEPTIYKRYELNRKLIDFNYIPQEIQDKIWNEYEACPKGNINRLLSYLDEHRLTHLARCIDEFV